MFRKLLVYLLASAIMMISIVAKAQTVQEKYISTYAEIAVQEMYRSGVPASITLAQGMLESGNGRSQLALKSNNHFGIKCHKGWTGERVYHDDDAKGECFRKYSHPHQSYRDHSDFLRYRDRYKFLFDLKTTDYKGWAYGLKQAGYATDPGYATKLIKLIEDYKLYQYDTKTVHTPKEKEDFVAQLPLSPTVIERVEPVSEQDAKKYFQVSFSREVYSKNGVPFIYSSEGETYETIADSYGLFVKELLKFNDLSAEEMLLPGTVVYLQAKKKNAAEGLEMHILEEGETARQIAQRYAVKLKQIYKLNGWAKDYMPKAGEVIKLRK